jgi:hypothetical protein
LVGLELRRGGQQKSPYGEFVFCVHEKFDVHSFRDLLFTPLLTAGWRGELSGRRGVGRCPVQAADFCRLCPHQVTKTKSGLEPFQAAHGNNYVNS